MSPFLCFGHRGARGHEPENTLRSIRRALDLGANGIEIDVWRVDGELVVFHDSTLERTTDGRGRLTRKSFAYLRTLDAGHGERIPTLREVCETIARRAVLNIELKGPRTAAAVTGFIREMIALHGWQYADFLVSSFSRRELLAVSDSQIPIGLLLARPSRLCWFNARRVRAVAVHPALRYTTRAFIDEAHRRGLRVYVYTVNDPADFARLRAWGVDGVFTDFPERA